MSTAPKTTTPAKSTAPPATTSAETQFPKAITDAQFKTALPVVDVGKLRKLTQTAFNASPYVGSVMGNTK
jgi:hypothetical protein